MCVVGIGLVLTFYTTIGFTLFLSDPNKVSDHPVADDWATSSWSLLVNMLLISIFILFHSLMAHRTFKEVLESYNITDLQRSIYVIITTLTLQVLMKNWHIITGVTLWKFSLTNKTMLWAYFLIHGIFWLLIYISTICVDINELLGIKQVYYKLKKLPDPLSQKSFQLKRLYDHMRHPGFSSFLVIFWVTPVMSLDRLLLAVVLSLYMYIAWKTDENDYEYQYIQYKRKYELNYLQ
ncbi:hypothetical protein Trydic_g17113 [Trypoxylus dichotomus]